MTPTQFISGQVTVERKCDDRYSQVECCVWYSDTET